MPKSHAGDPTACLGGGDFSTISTGRLPLRFGKGSAID